LREGGKSAFRLHASFLLCTVDALHNLPEKTLLYLFVKKLLTGHLVNKSAKGEKGQYFTPRHVIDMACRCDSSEKVSRTV
jgi:type I restriction enzyme M protein